MKRLAVLLVAAMVTACSSPYSQSGATRRAPTPRPRRVTAPARIRLRTSSSSCRKTAASITSSTVFPKPTATFGYGHGVKYPLQDTAAEVEVRPQPLSLSVLEDLRRRQERRLRSTDSRIDVGRPLRMTGSTIRRAGRFEPARVYQKMAFSYTKKSDIQPYWTMASRYTLGDHNFASTNGPSFGPHQELIAGQDGHASEVPSKMPWGCDAPKETEWYLAVRTVESARASRRRSAMKSWAAIRASRIPRSRTCWMRRTSRGAGTSSQKSFTGTPGLVLARRVRCDQGSALRPRLQERRDARHASAHRHRRPAAAAGVVGHAARRRVGSRGRRLGQLRTGLGDRRSSTRSGKSQYWNSTAIVITWDEWGGWFDHVVPPQYADPQTGAYEGLRLSDAADHRVAVRQEALRVEVAARNGVGTALHREDVRPAVRSGHDDARADAYDDVFNFSQKPTTFKTIPAAAELVSVADDLPGREGVTDRRRAGKGPG